MGLETIGPHSHKVQTKVYKIPKFGENRPKCQNLQRNISPSGRCPNNRMAIHFFVNFDGFKWLYLSQN